jgi:ATP/maltotriose-dependent transcriptional regulator MalT
MALYRLVYASTSMLSGDADAARQQIADILSSSRRNNAADDITGALLFSDTNFAQVLEGPRAAVERLYETLHHDTRHKDLLLLLTEELEARQFPQWSMAYIGPSQPAQEALALAAEGVGDSSQGTRVRRLLALMSETLHRGGAKQAP